MFVMKLPFKYLADLVLLTKYVLFLSHKSQLLYCRPGFVIGGISWELMETNEFHVQFHLNFILI